MSPGPGSEALARALADLDWDEAARLLGVPDARSYCVAVDTALSFVNDMVRGELAPQVERDVVFSATVAWGVTVGLDTAQFASLLAVAARTVDPPEPGVVEALNAKGTKPGGGGKVVPFQPRDVMRRAASRHPDRTDPSTRRRRGR